MKRLQKAKSKRQDGDGGGVYQVFEVSYAKVMGYPKSVRVPKKWEGCIRKIGDRVCTYNMDSMF